LTRGVPLLLSLALAAGCASTLDHQAELLLHPSPWVQAPALVGAAPGALVGLPVWGTVALIDGADGDAAAYTFHVFAYGGALVIAVAPWWIVGPSWAQIGPERDPRNAGVPSRRGSP
jgi:hypothetical protein